MEIKVFDTGAGAASYVADSVISLNLELSGSMNLGVATGRTMDAVYHNLVKKSLEQNVDFSKVKTFALDEYIGLVENSQNSYRAYLNHHLHSQLNFRMENTFLPEVLNEEIDKSCLEYEEKLQASGGVDLQLLGIGLNGHIALNEPGSSHDSRTRVVALTESTIRSNKSLFEGEIIPLTALTMGVGTIYDSKHCMLLATGESKAQIIFDLINNKESSFLPASFLKSHPNFTLVLDKYSSKLLK